MELSEVVPWGRSLAEYRTMFSLSTDDCEKKYWVVEMGRRVLMQS